jgi:hypothetical protein
MVVGPKFRSVTGAHPAQDRMPDASLDIRDHLTGIRLIPAPVEVLGHHPELDDEIAGQILAALFAPQPDQRLLVIAHDDSGV